MATYRIASRSGADHGTWSGASPAAALAALHRAAGYPHVRARGGQIIWPDAETRAICGDVGEWDITSKSPRTGPRRAGSVLVPLTVEERERLRSAARADSRPLSAWIRLVALRAAEPPT